MSKVGGEPYPFYRKDDISDAFHRRIQDHDLRLAVFLKENGHDDLALLLMSFHRAEKVGMKPTVLTGLRWTPDNVYTAMNWDKREYGDVVKLLQDTLDALPESHVRLRERIREFLSP